MTGDDAQRFAGLGVAAGLVVAICGAALFALNWGEWLMMTLSAVQFVGGAVMTWVYWSIRQR